MDISSNISTISSAVTSLKPGFPKSQNGHLNNYVYVLMGKGEEKKGEKREKGKGEEKKGKGEEKRERGRKKGAKRRKREKGGN